MKVQDIFGVMVLFAVVVPVDSVTPLWGADESVRLPIKAPPSRRLDWTGWYVGGHFGYGTGTYGAGTNPAINQAVLLPPSLTGFIGGFQAGYNVHLSNNVVLGLEADLTVPSPPDRPATGILPYNTTIDYFGTVRSRIGYAFDDVVPYMTAGLAWGRTTIHANDADGNAVASQSAMHVGWTAGAGVERALMGRWAAKAEYNYIALGPRTSAFDFASPNGIAVDPRIHAFKLGLNYRLWDGTPSLSVGAAGLEKTSVPDSDDWSIHGQTTFVAQGYGRIRSPYQGPNSLPGSGQGRETWTATAFIGRRLWDGGEIYFNPELAQGFGLAGTLGLGGFSNGEAQKAGATYPRIRAQRYFLRQTIGLGGEQEIVEDGPNQLSGKRDIDRITVTVGRFAIGDFFDANTYAHDPRADFMNWAIWSSGAYDFPADLPGFTRGAVVELNRKQWALRAGVYQVPEEPNSDVLTFKTGGVIAEFEGRYSIFGQPGKTRIGAFANRGGTGNYRQALAISTANPATDINDAIVSVRRQNWKSGFYVNAEQALTEDVGVFARASWNDGQNEILSFTDIDRSVSGGVSIKGIRWGRPSDTVGIAGAINGLSVAHRDFLAAGGIGLLIGDGALNYREEKIFETYYAWVINKSTTMTFNYQFVTNPAYNADRGPVSIFAGRVHAEF